MKAAIYNGNNQMAVVDVPKPKPGGGEVVLKVHACGICGSDLHAIQYGSLQPHTVMGHEFCGEIHEIGSSVSGYSVGERVTSLPYISCGECADCRAGEGMRCVSIRG